MRSTYISSTVRKGALRGLSSISRKALEEACEYLVATDRRVVCVGAAARTWFVDLVLLQYALTRLAFLEPTVVSGGKFPFDMYVEELCESNDITWEPAYHLSRKKRLRKEYRRPVSTWMDCDLIVVFPESTELDTADPLVDCITAPKLIIPREEDWSMEWEI